MKPIALFIVAIALLICAISLISLWIIKSRSVQVEQSKPMVIERVDDNDGSIDGSVYIITLRTGERIFYTYSSKGCTATLLPYIKVK